MTVRLLLDTNVISDFVRGEPEVQHRLRATAPAHLAVPSVTVTEIAYGLARNPPRARRIASLLEQLIGAISVLEYTEADARETGRVRAELETAGRPIGLCDAMLAAVTRARHLTLVTHNADEFARVEHLRLVDWRSSAHPGG